MQVRYRHWDPALGWDVRSTEVTQPENGGACIRRRCRCGPARSGSSTSAYPGDGQPHLMLKRREPAGSGQLECRFRRRAHRNGCSPSAPTRCVPARLSTSPGTATRRRPRPWSTSTTPPAVAWRRRPWRTWTAAIAARSAPRVRGWPSGVLRAPAIGAHPGRAHRGLPLSVPSPKLLSVGLRCIPAGCVVPPRRIDWIRGRRHALPSGRSGGLGGKAISETGH